MFDLIGALTSEVGVQPTQARAIAGRFLGHLAQGISDRFGVDASEAFLARLPHWEEWQAGEPYLMPLDRAIQGAALGTDARLAEILGHLGIDPVKAGIALPALVRYLKANLPLEMLRQVYVVAPFLTSAASEYGHGYSAPTSDLGI